jgi:uncharacterized protein with PhoU and TrkA domain
MIHSQDQHSEPEAQPPEAVRAVDDLEEKAAALWVVRSVEALMEAAAVVAALVVEVREVEVPAVVMAVATVVV